MPTAAIAGSDLYYEARGHGPSILFIHGLLADAGTWAEQIDLLSVSFQCVAYDRCGNSRSRMAHFPVPGPTGHAEDAADLIRKLALQPCLVVASSIGGVFAIELMRRFPELLLGAVLSEPALLSLDPDGGRALMGKLSTDLTETLRTAGLRAAVELFSQEMDADAWLKATNDERGRMAANVPALLTMLRSDEYRIEPEDLALIRVPCLVIRGDKSPKAFQVVARRLSELLPVSRLAELPKSGHFTYVHQPDEFARLVREFASELL